jgi:hypothetical protein
MYFTTGGRMSNLTSHQTDELCQKYIPYNVGNIVEYSKSNISFFGRVEEVSGRFVNSKEDKRVHISFRINGDLVPFESVVRKVSEI